MPEARKTASQTPNHEPTPEEIREACREIQSEWTKAERLRRLAVKPREWSIPTTIQSEDLQL